MISSKEGVLNFAKAVGIRVTESQAEFVADVLLGKIPLTRDYFPPLYFESKEIDLLTRVINREIKNA